MAFCTIHSNGLIVHVGVARDTLVTGIFENQRGMAAFAVHILVHPGEWIAGRAVVESISARFQFPAFGVMTVGTRHVEVFSMRRLGIKISCYRQ